MVVQEVRICFACRQEAAREDEQSDRQADRQRDRRTCGQTVSPSAPNKCPGRKWSALTVFLSLPSLGLFIFVSAAAALGKSETNVILSCRNSKENCDRTLSRTRTLVHCAITCIHISVCTLCSFPCELCDFMTASRRIAGQDLWSMCQNTRALVALSVAVATRVAVRVDGAAQSIDHSSALSLFALNQASSGLREKD